MTTSISAFVDAIREQLGAGNGETAFRVFICLNDALVAAETGYLPALTTADPGTTGSARFDALVGGLVEHTLTVRGLPVPAWVNTPSRFLAEQWFVDASPYSRANDRETTPRAFARRNVILAATELASV